jgi:hypothetical protein
MDVETDLKELESSCGVTWDDVESLLLAKADIDDIQGIVSSPPASLLDLALPILLEKSPQVVQACLNRMKIGTPPTFVLDIALPILLQQTPRVVQACVQKIGMVEEVRICVKTLKW